MADQTLFTAVQVSDLHFGSAVAGSAKPGDLLLRLAPWFEGWLDHHRIGLRELHRFFSEFGDRGIRPVLVVSGDLTANGAVRQFELADALSEI